MKRRWTAQSGLFSLRGLTFGAACLIIVPIVSALALFRPDAPEKHSQRTLTFADRVAYQRAIEEVYWRHRIWPQANAKAKGSLDSVLSAAELENKVAGYLRKSQALEEYWQRPITSGQLQAEMDRIAGHTKQPEVLRELFTALGNNPFIVAECLARPLVAERLAASMYAHDQKFQGELKLQPESRRASVDKRAPYGMAAATATYNLPTIPNGAACSDDTWTVISTTNAPAARASHTAVWTGSEMIVWGGFGGSYVNTGGIYNPTTDTWTPTSTVNAPSARGGHSAVWTGSEMIIWGGDNGMSLNTGGRYNPATNSWTATSTTNAPTGRLFHTALWSGSHMIVWGGWGEVEFNTGGRYDPNTDSWTATSTASAPAARFNHTAVWTDSEMIVWGGWNGTTYFNTGGRYNPGTDNWTAISTANAPTARYYHTAVWTGSDMIVWGGRNGGDYFNTGGKYNPNTDSWAAPNTASAPSARSYHTAVWTDSKMIVWGGTDGREQFSTGGRYNPDTDDWMATTTFNGPERRASHTAVWSGSEMMVWGGLTDNGPFYLNTGGRYCASTPAGSCSVQHVSPCDTVVSNAPTDFTVEMSCPVDLVQPSGFLVNNVGPSSFEVSTNTITFHYSTSPAVPGLNTIHILFDAIFCCSGSPSSEFTCTFTYAPGTPTPTATATSTATPTPRPTPVPRSRPTPPPRP